MVSDPDFSENGHSSEKESPLRTSLAPNRSLNGTDTLQQHSTATVMSNPTAPTDPNAQSVGLFDPGVSEARRRKLDAINRLSSLGVQRDIDLPQIVVIGSQSAGKSSLIESISGITLPRASGTCTRCPTECRLIHSNDPWRCVISLRFTTDDAGRLLDKVRNIPFGPPIRDRRQVEDRLRRAQRAILNPAIQPERFLEGSQAPEHNELAFSANCVSLEIRGPDVTDLSFVDLPGLISSVADGGRDSDVEEVKNLVTSYISKPSCIILLTVACESDFETQGAYRLARQHDQGGTRTIGVLTKPDRIPEGEETRWIKLIKNEISALQHGWFCVKQPSSKELDAGLSFQEARRRGEEFFVRPPWSRLERYRKRLGTEALTLKLNEFLMAVISKRIPEIMQELQRILQQTREELQDLPKPSTQEPVLELMHLIGTFSDELFSHAEGFSHDAVRSSGENDNVVKKNFFQSIDREHAKFKQSIRATAPNFRPFDRRETHEEKAATNADEQVSYRDEEAISQDEEVPGRDEEASGDPDVTGPELSTLEWGNAEYEPKFLRPEEGEIFPSKQPVILRDDVVKQVQKATTRELPGYNPFQVVQVLISRSTDQWGAPGLSLIYAIHEIVVGQQTKLIEKHFGHHTEGGLCHTVLNIMHEYMQERRDESIQRVKWLLKLEGHPFTVNKAYFSMYRRRFLNFYRTKEGCDTASPKVVSQPWDPNQSAVEIMATVRAYFHVAYKRVVDTVPLAIDMELVRVHKRGVQEALATGLKITGSDGTARCKMLLAEPATVVARREDLGNQLQRLEAAQRELLGI